jgi:hypothetical protein
MRTVEIDYPPRVDAHPNLTDRLGGSKRRKWRGDGMAWSQRIKVVSALQEQGHEAAYPGGCE